MAEPWYATAFGAFYPLLYGHRDRAEAARCVDLLSGLQPLAPPVLDLGCGEGRHLDLLGARVGTSWGLDLSAPLLARARAAGPSRLLVRGDMRTLPCRNGSCGTVMSLFTAFGYFAAKGDDQATVAEIARALAPGGHWCLDYLDGERVRRELAGRPAKVRRREAGPLSVEERRIYDDASRKVRKDVWLQPLRGREGDAQRLGCGPGGLRYTEEVRVYTVAELDAMAAASGLARVAAAGGYGGEPLGEGDRWLLVYRRGTGGGSR